MRGVETRWVGRERRGECGFRGLPTPPDANTESWPKQGRKERFALLDIRARSTGRIDSSRRRRAFCLRGAWNVRGDAFGAHMVLGGCARRKGGLGAHGEKGSEKNGRTDPKAQDACDKTAQARTKGGVGSTRLRERKGAAGDTGWQRAAGHAGKAGQTLTAYLCSLPRIFAKKVL